MSAFPVMSARAAHCAMQQCGKSFKPWTTTIQNACLEKTHTDDQESAKMVRVRDVEMVRELVELRVRGT